VSIHAFSVCMHEQSKPQSIPNQFGHSLPKQIGDKKIRHTEETLPNPAHTNTWNKGPFVYSGEPEVSEVSSTILKYFKDLRVL